MTTLKCSSIVCSGSLVVTAFDSESGRPGSNPEWGQYTMRLRSLHRAHPSLHPSGVVHWVPEQLNIKAVTGACKLIDDCSRALCSATVSVVSAGICYRNKVNSTAWLYRDGPSHKIVSLTLHNITYTYIKKKQSDQHSSQDIVCSGGGGGRYYDVISELEIILTPDVLYLALFNSNTLDIHSKGLNFSNPQTRIILNFKMSQSNKSNSWLIEKILVKIYTRTESWYDNNNHKQAVCTDLHVFWYHVNRNTHQ